MKTQNKNALAVRGSFSIPTAVTTRRAPASPMVVQSLIDAITNLSEQVNTLAVRQVQQPQVIHVPASLPVKHVDSRESDFDFDSPKQKHQSQA